MYPEMQIHKEKGTHGRDRLTCHQDQMDEQRRVTRGKTARHRIVVWNGHAEYAADKPKKGDLCMSWERS